MEILLITINKAKERFIAEGTNYYLKKIRPYVKIALVELVVSHPSGQSAAVAEGHLILKTLKPKDYICLLDENGESCNSKQFAQRLQKIFNSGVKRLVFIIGGSYGFSPEVRDRAHDSFSLSPMTFSHQLARILFAEQLYRALNIIHGGSYHHQ
jgi:23S rRNA (pseudouridine1915-N3)-methyltransferase